jgi:rhodanese-related sulfurtransferase
VTRLHAALALVAAVLAGAAGGADLASPVSLRTAARPPAFITAPDLAGRIMKGDAALRLFDLRTAESYRQFHIPTAVHMAPADLAVAPLDPGTDVVLYGDDRRSLGDAVRTLRTRRPSSVHVLREGLSEWLGRVHEPRLAVDATQEERVEFERAAALSRFFGGMPLANVPRGDVPAGYWTGAPRSDALLAAAALESVAAIRRRGC